MAGAAAAMFPRHVLPSNAPLYVNDRTTHSDDSLRGHGYIQPIPSSHEPSNQSSLRSETVDHDADKNAATSSPKLRLHDFELIKTLGTGRLGLLPSS